jgi:cold shock CspA family protein
MATTWTGPFELAPVGGTPLVGDVAAFDEERGLGLVEYGHGRALSFHCTAITDGSRRIDVGAVVAFVVGAGRLGQLEARSVRPLPGVVRPGSTLEAGAARTVRPGEVAVGRPGAAPQLSGGSDQAGGNRVPGPPPFDHASVATPPPGSAPVGPAGSAPVVSAPVVPVGSGPATSVRTASGPSTSARVAPPAPVSVAPSPVAPSAPVSVAPAPVAPSPPVPVAAAPAPAVVSGADVPDPSDGGPTGPTRASSDGGPTGFGPGVRRPGCQGGCHPA